MRVVLRFEGVDSCLRAWVNGAYVGTARGSRLPAEFDVGWALRPGEENVLAVRVHQWSSGSYLEDQDMWWLSGIFRDVSLLARPPGAIDDVFVHADYDHVTGAGEPARGRRRSTCMWWSRSWASTSSGGETVVVERVEPWSAEVPRLYDCVVASAGERVVLRIGFRRVTIEDDLLLVNGHRVLLRGVNRHEFVARRRAGGRARRDMRRDVELMKAHNVNAVRTSHYPPHPRFLDAVRRARALRDRRVRPRDARVRRGRLAAQPGRRAGVGGGAAWTGCGGWSSATRTTRA